MEKFNKKKKKKRMMGVWRGDGGRVARGLVGDMEGSFGFVNFL